MYKLIVENIKYEYDDIIRLISSLDEDLDIEYDDYCYLIDHADFEILIDFLNKKYKVIKIKETNKKLDNCPFCGEEVEYYIHDDESNIRNLEYEKNPYSGLWYSIKHEYSNDNNCIIATYEDESIGTRMFSTLEEMIEKWNNKF